MSKLKDYLGVILAFAAVVGIVLGALNYFARADDLKLVEMRLDQKIVSDQVQQIQARIWTLEDRNGGKPCGEWKSQDEKNEYRRLNEQLKLLDEKQKAMIKK